MKWGEPNNIIGDPLTKSGALCIIRAESIEDDIANAHYTFLIFSLFLQGIEPSPIVVRMTRMAATDYAKKFISRHRSIGVPGIFKELFEKNKKKDSIAYIKNLSIDSSQFSSLIFNADQIGYVHERLHKEIIPSELKTTEAESEALTNNGLGKLKSTQANKFVKKIFATFKQRKFISAHLFENKNGWHLFWFTFDDMNSEALGKKAHWSQGDHIHYTSYLWCHDKEELLGKLESGHYSIAGAHIKYVNK